MCHETPVLPAEIWQAIAHHLSHQDLFRIFSLNHALLDLALTQGYHTVNPFKDRVTYQYAIRYLKHLSEPHIARRIRKLEISSTTVFDYDPAFLYSSFARIAYALPLKLGTLLHKEIHVRTRIQKLAYQLIPKLINLTSISVNGILYTGPLYSTFTSRLWSHQVECRQKLQHVQLRIHMCHAAELLQVVPISLRLLETITIQLVACNSSCECQDEGTQEILSFLRQATSSSRGATSSLRTLKLQLDAETPSPNLLGNICTALERTPRLEEFSLGLFNPQSNIVKPISWFLLRNAATFRRLTLPSLNYLRPDELADAFDPFPQLSSLRLYGSSIDFSSTLRTMEGFFRQSLAHLQSFELHRSLVYSSLNYSQLEELLETLTSPSPHSPAPLSRLAVPITALSPEVFCLLYRHLPNVKILNLQCKAVLASSAAVQTPRMGSLADVYDENNTRDNFLTYLRGKSFKGWGLREVNLALRCSEQQRIGIRGLLEECLRIVVSGGPVLMRILTTVEPLNVLVDKDQRDE